MSFPPVKQQLDLIKRNSVEIIPVEELEKKLNKNLKYNKTLRIKIG
jgi:tyrosyl-tRNA synthetase